MKKISICKTFCLCSIALSIALGGNVITRADEETGISNTSDELEWQFTLEELEKENGYIEKQAPTLEGAIKADKYIDISAHMNTQAENLDQKAYPDLKDTIYEEAAAALSELNVLNGYEDGTFKPEKALTRAEFITAVMRMVTQGEQAIKSAAPKICFGDVALNHWAFDTISAAAEQGLINGYVDGRFLPDNPVTYNQAVKILICALGYSEKAEKAGGYPYGYLLEAAELGISEKITAEFENYITRGMAALLMNNALDVTMANKKTPRQIKSGVYATYYVSPSGSDDNPGTEEKPWKTMYKSLKKLHEGAVLIMEDGEYYENHASVIASSGSEFAPIVIKARNKHKAKIVYTKNLSCTYKFNLLEGVSYVTIEDVSFTQEERATADVLSPTHDLYIFAHGKNSNIIVRGNYLEKMYEEGIKLFLASDCIIENNIVYDSVHEGIDCVNCTDFIIRNNVILETGRVAVMCKGGTRNSCIYNNYVRNEDITQSDCSFTVGGSTNNTSPLDINEGTGFEQYNCQLYNNIVYSESGKIRWGFNLCSSRESRVFNNIVVGAIEAAVRVKSSLGTQNGWKWDPPNRDVMVYNNIFKDCNAVYQIDHEPENLMSDYNIYYNAGLVPEEEHSIYRDPMLANPAEGDFSLKSGSPAIGAAADISFDYIGYGGVAKRIIPVDFTGKEITHIRDIGAYQMTD